MSDYLILTDSTTDLPLSYFKEHNVQFVTLPYTIDGETYEGDHQLDGKTFYEKMRSGSLPTTSQVNPEVALEAFRNIVSEHNCDILCIAFSSGLSGTYNSFRIAAEEFAEDDTAHKIIVIDSLAASMGEGLMVHKAVCLKKEGYSLEENAKWITEHRENFVHNFTVDDLFHLHRGGRVSKATAIVGTLASVKPILHVDSEGHLINVGKVRGRKKALSALVDAMEKQIGEYKDKNDIIFISHGDCEDEAKEVATMVTRRLGFTNFLINPISPTIGAHAGPGTVALFYLGEYR
ncbi:MAG: DegV family protein [Lachnospiraceae bacterium]|jgi:DegV family protein with EDD domain|nr:DegV family protein [Lachnospiraceae bacterium]